MSTIEEVRAAEKKVQEVLEALKKTGAQYANDLGTELKNATDEYARAVRELSSKLRTKARRVAGSLRRRTWGSLNAHNTLRRTQYSPASLDSVSVTPITSPVITYVTRRLHSSSPSSAPFWPPSEAY